MLFDAGFTSLLEPGGSTAIRLSSGGTALDYGLTTTAVQVDSNLSAVPLTPDERVQSAYVAFYERPADCPGFRYWAGQLAAGKLSDIIQAFGTSAEFDERYGGLTDTQLVDNVYEQMFNRLPDPAGRAFYIRMLQSGQMTLQTITINVLDGALNTNRTIIENKIEVARHFTGELCASGLAYTDLDEAIAIISGVDPTAESIEQAKTDSGTLIESYLQ